MAGIPESLGGGGPQRDAELSSGGPRPTRIPKQARRSEQTDDSIWTIRDSEIFLTRYIDPMVRRSLGKSALQGDFSLRRETITSNNNSQERLLAEIDRRPGWPLSMVVQMINAEPLSSADLLVQWPNVVDIGLADRLGLIENRDEEGHYLIPDAFPEDVCEDPIMAYVNRKIHLERGRRPLLTLETGFLYLDEFYCSYDQAHEVYLASQNPELLSEDPEERALFVNMTRHLLHNIEWPDMAELRYALKKLDIVK